MSKYDGLILTVGMTHEPVVYSIQQASAQKVAFICTPDSEKTLDQVLNAVQLPSSAWRKYVVNDDPSQIGNLCSNFYAGFRWLTENCGIDLSHTAADPTAGRKWMSAGATMIAAFLGMKMHYVDVRYVSGQPDPTTMRIIELGNAYDQTGFIAADKGRVLFNEYEFATAAEIFNSIKPSMSAQSDLYSGLADLARTLDDWERFEHYKRSLQSHFEGALAKLRRYLASIEGEKRLVADFVEGVHRLSRDIESIHRRDRPDILFSIDVFVNAQRRIKQRRYDDACARLYRVLESISQFYLHKDFGIDTARPSYSSLTSKQIETVEKSLGTLPNKIELNNGFKILRELGHPTSDVLFAPNMANHKFIGLLKERNSSILAHGFEPIEKKKVETFSARLETLFQDLLREMFDDWKKRLEVPKLPPLIA